jgi:hypothetical protein
MVLVTTLLETQLANKYISEFSAESNRTCLCPGTFVAEDRHFMYFACTLLESEKQVIGSWVPDFLVKKILICR